MRKTGHISKSTQMYPKLLFEQPEDVQLQAFYNTPLGALYQAIPFDNLIKHFPKPKRAISGKGCKPWFNVKGWYCPSDTQIILPYQRCHACGTDQRQLADANVLRYTIAAWRADKG